MIPIDYMQFFWGGLVVQSTNQINELETDNGWSRASDLHISRKLGGSDSCFGTGGTTPLPAKLPGHFEAVLDADGHGLTSCAGGEISR